MRQRHFGDAAVTRVRPLPSVASSGSWPCALCLDLFPVRDSWRITYATGERAIVCRRCAERSRRKRTRHRKGP